MPPVQVSELFDGLLHRTIPSKRAPATMVDDAIVETLTQVRGVGRWTVGMLLMFQVGRQDIFPVDDFGVRNRFLITHGLSEMPTAKAALALSERNRPYRTIAALVLVARGRSRQATRREDRVKHRTRLRGIG